MQFYLRMCVTCMQYTCRCQFEHINKNTDEDEVNNYHISMQIEVSFDGGWQKRGTGWNYDSNTGKIDIGV